MYKSFIRPVFFRVEPEKIHHFVVGALRAACALPGVKALLRKQYQVQHVSLKRTLFGLTFDNPVGLAAGFDKDARLFEEMACLGFGFVEVGTLTPKPQEGNPLPRMFRLPKDSALINRMGFNNEGVWPAVERLKKRKTRIIIGGNIGKNKLTPNDEALNDYLMCFDALYEHVDYFVVNVSSPNTPNLRALQDKEPLTALLMALKKENARKPSPRPILLKIAPDLTTQQLDDIISIVSETRIDGVIATNTTISRDNLITPPGEISAIAAGGLSGKPLTRRSTEVIRYLHSHSGGAFPIIGVGGIHSPEDAIEKLEAGASLIQLYTGFIYEGPELVRKINEELVKRQSMV
jgi:dihydroorotate dehydrogenase